MSRYIDADALECDTEWSEYHDGFISYSQLEIDTAPSIDIVRCGECKSWHKNIKEGEDIPVHDACYYFNADDFCSYGEREGE